MTNKSTLTAVQITDKNGKRTTVHKNLAGPPSPTRATAALAPKPASAKRDIDADGYDRDTGLHISTGLSRRGFDGNGIHAVTGLLWDAMGCDDEGHRILTDLLRQYEERYQEMSDDEDGAYSNCLYHSHIEVELDSWDEMPGSIVVRQEQTYEGHLNSDGGREEMYDYFDERGSIYADDIPFDEIAESVNESNLSQLQLSSIRSIHVAEMAMNAGMLAELDDDDRDIIQTRITQMTRYSTEVDNSGLLFGAGDVEDFFDDWLEDRHGLTREVADEMKKNGIDRDLAASLIGGGGLR